MGLKPVNSNCGAGLFSEQEGGSGVFRIEDDEESL